MPRELYLLRKRAGLTHEELAKRAGVSRITVIRHEQGETPRVVKIALAIAKALREAEDLDNVAQRDATIEGIYGREPERRQRR